MPIRTRGKKLEWRFKVDGHEYSHITDLDDTARNRIKAQRMEAEARRLVLEGREAELRIQVQPFSSAAESFCMWADGEYREHRNSSKRIRVSMTSTKVFFGKRPFSAITRGDVEDYKSYRRTVTKVREVTLRHDLHALSLLFQYGQKHNWCKGNPVRQVEIPSDREAVRINVLSPVGEFGLFATIDALLLEKSAKKRTREVRGLQDLRDLAVLMLNQGCRPEELRSMRQSDVDLEAGMMAIRRGKTGAARRTLPLVTASRDVMAKRMGGGEWVFPSQQFPAQHIGQAQRLWGAVVKKAGLSLVMYDLRHTFATRAIERGVEIPKLMAILGHANLRTIMRYVHMTQAHIEDGMRKFETAVLPAPCPPDSSKHGEQTAKGSKSGKGNQVVVN